MLKTDLVQVKNKEIFTTSKIVADKLEVPHKNFLRTIEKIIDMQTNLGGRNGAPKFSQKFIETELEHGKTKIKYKGYLINEPAFIKIVMQLGKYKKANEVQDLFIDAFFQMKEALQNKSNASWIKAREKGKITRVEETDVIKEFVEYATNQGSKNAKFYYSNITKMTNKALELLIQIKEGKPIRDFASATELGFISSLDDRAMKAIKYGMEQKLPYKYIYDYAKEEVNKLAESLDFKPKLDNGNLYK